MHSAAPNNIGFLVDFVTHLYNLSTVASPSRARAVLQEALVLIEQVEQAKQLPSGQQDLPKLIRDQIQVWAKRG
jgi:hypothetical protein